jgi:hypothetical protein
MIKTLILAMMVVYLVVMPQTIRAADPSDCVRDGQCVGNQRCKEVAANSGIFVFEGTCGSVIVGGVTAPEAIRNYNVAAILGGGTGSIGILVFASRLIQLATVIAGIWVMANFIIAGYQYIVGFGDTNAHKAVRERLTWSVVGLVIIIAAYAGAGIIGLFFFGDASFILNPELSSALD